MAAVHGVVDAVHELVRSAHVAGDVLQHVHAVREGGHVCGHGRVDESGCVGIIQWGVCDYGDQGLKVRLARSVAPQSVNREDMGSIPGAFRPAVWCVRFG